MYGFYIGWTDELKDSQLSIYQVKVCDHDGAEVIFSLILEKDFPGVSSSEDNYV